MKTRIHLGLFQLYLQQKSVSSSLSLSALKLPEAKKIGYVWRSTCLHVHYLVVVFSVALF